MGYENHDFTDGKTSFLHASDLHLGCKQYTNETLADDYLDSLIEILEIAIEKNVDFIIFGGDIFNSIDILPAIFLKIIKILTNFKETTNSSIPIVTIEGNHDLRRYSHGHKFLRGQSWLKSLAEMDLIIILSVDLEIFLNLPDNKEFFQDYNPITRKGSKIKIKKVWIYGTQFHSQDDFNNIEQITKAIHKDHSNFNILIQHLGIAGQMQGVPGLFLRDLKELQKKVDYLALGHFHKQFTIDNWIFNPGSSEATSLIDHSYKRGIFFVEIRFNPVISKKIQQIKLNNRECQWINIIIRDKFRDYLQLSKYLVNNIDRQISITNNKKKPIICINLRGFEPFYGFKLNIKLLENNLMNLDNIADIRIFSRLKEKLITLDNFIID